MSFNDRLKYLPTCTVLLLGNDNHASQECFTASQWLPIYPKFVPKPGTENSAPCSRCVAGLWGALPTHGFQVLLCPDPIVPEAMELRIQPDLSLLLLGGSLGRKRLGQLL